MAWIRSQDNDLLINVQSVWIKRASQQTNPLLMGDTTDYDGNYGSTLGVFETDEAALEELNRIHNWIITQKGRGVWQISREELKGEMEED